MFFCVRGTKLSTALISAAQWCKSHAHISFLSKVIELFICGNSTWTKNRQHSSSTSSALVTKPNVGTRQCPWIKRCQSHLIRVNKGNSSVAAALDHCPWNSKIVPWNNLLSLSEGVHWKVRMCQSCNQMHYIVLLFWRLLDFQTDTQKLLIVLINFLCNLTLAVTYMYFIEFWWSQKCHKMNRHI